MKNPSSDVDKNALFAKLKKYSKKLGCKTVCTVATLWFTLRSEKTPAWVKAQITGSLVYFLVPFDFIPDVLPMGFVDDLKVLALALGTASMYISDNEKKLATQVVQKWLPDCKCQPDQTVV